LNFNLRFAAKANGLFIFSIAGPKGTNMPEWKLHWLEAEGDLELWRPQIAAEIQAAQTTLSRSVAPPLLDILVERIPGKVIPEIGIAGHVYRRSLFALTLDPDNPNFASSLRDGNLRRHVRPETAECAPSLTEK
jgi:hypothetical protein